MSILKYESVKEHKFVYLSSDEKSLNIEISTPGESWGNRLKVSFPMKDVIKMFFEEEECPLCKQVVKEHNACIHRG